MQRALFEMELSWLRERYKTVIILPLSQNPCYTFIARFAFQLPRSRVPIVISCVCGEIARPLTLRNSRAKHQDWFVLECNTMCIVIRTERRLRRLIVDLSSAPLLWDGLILVQDVRGHVIQVLQSLASHAACHKGPQSVTGKGQKGHSWKLYQHIIQIAFTLLISFEDNWRWMVRQGVMGMWRISGISSQVKL